MVVYRGEGLPKQNLGTSALHRGQRHAARAVLPIDFSPP
jgi:hypothetical protein